MSTLSLLALQQAVDSRRPLLRAAIDLDYSNKPGALHQVSFDIARGEVLGLIGESGSGKSSVALCLMRLLRQSSSCLTGSIQFDGRELLSIPEREMRKIRGRDIGLVLQSPLASLNPALRIGTQFEEAWRAHRNTPRDEMRSNIGRAISLVSLPSGSEILSRYPRELSVGLAQRVLIGMAILHGPKLLIADEPTSALDVITSAEILKLFVRLNRELGTAILFISHDLLSVAWLCDRVAIMRQGSIVECAPTSQIFSAPAHEYTQALVAALPRLPAGLQVMQADASGVAVRHPS
jgi:ABC-type dipeptide/oligopeptide/nickel transport system ATPase component